MNIIVIFCTFVNSKRIGQKPWNHSGSRVFYDFDSRSTPAELRRAAGGLAAALTRLVAENPCIFRPLGVFHLPFPHPLTAGEYRHANSGCRIKTKREENRQEATCKIKYCTLCNSILRLRQIKGSFACSLASVVDIRHMLPAAPDEYHGGERA